MSYPYWLDSEKVSWTCLRDLEPRPLENSEICRDCPRWQSRRLGRDES